MSKAARSLQIFGIYLIVLSLGFLIIPNYALRIFGFPETTEPWIRIMGMLMLFLAYYYIQSARKELKAFFQLTVHVRASVILFLLAFVALGLAKPILILFGVVDFSAAIWTAIALRSE